MLEYSTAACAVPAHVPGTETPPLPWYCHREGGSSGEQGAAGSRSIPVGSGDPRRDGGGWLFPLPPRITEALRRGSRARRHI